MSQPKPKRTSASLDDILTSLTEAKQRCARDEQQLEQVHVLWGIIRQFIEMNDPKIDAVLTKASIVFEHEGQRIFPRPPDAPKVIFDAKKTN